MPDVYGGREDIPELKGRIRDGVAVVAFVCHSRGGLVARRTAVELLEASHVWRPRLRACVTFGTPRFRERATSR